MVTKKQPDADNKDIEQNMNKDNSINSEQAQDNIDKIEEVLSEEKNTSNTIETLKQQLEVLKQKSDRNHDLALRAKAELDNVRKRTALDIANAHKYGLEKFIPELFPILDGLNQGLNTIPDDEAFKSVKDGLSLSIKIFSDVLVKFGVEIIDPSDDAFDPAKHEAISMQVSNEVAPGTVLAVIQKGYVLNNRVLRPARVVVAKLED